MTILIAPALLFGTTGALWIFRVLRPRFRFSWLMATGTTSLAWLSVWSWRIRPGQSVTLYSWQTPGAYAGSISFVADGLSWLFALSLVTLALALLLTAPVRTGFPNPASWAISLGLIGLGVLAALTANALTLVLIWAALDLLEFLAMLTWSNGRPMGNWAIAVFALRTGGTAVLLLAQVAASGAAKPMDFASLAPQVGFLLLTAAALRLCVVPISQPYSSEPSLRRGAVTGLRLVSAAASLVLLARIPAGSLAALAASILLPLFALAALYAGWMWLRAPDEIAGRPFWMAGLSCLALGSALRGNPVGAAAWSAGLILSGGVVFLSSVQQPWLSGVLLIGAWSISSLPFSLTAAGWRNDSGVFDVALPAYLIAQALLLAGFVSRAARPSARSALASQPAWAKNAYPAGILLLLLVQVLLGLFGWTGAAQPGVLIAGIAVAIVSLGVLWATPRIPRLNRLPAGWLPGGYAGLDRLHGILWRIGRSVEGATQTITRTLEGEAGVMWSLLLLVLFVSLLVGRKP